MFVPRSCGCPKVAHAQLSLHKSSKKNKYSLSWFAQRRQSSRQSNEVAPPCAFRTLTLLSVSPDLVVLVGFEEKVNDNYRRMDNKQMRLFVNYICVFKTAPVSSSRLFYWVMRFMRVIVLEISAKVVYSVHKWSQTCEGRPLIYRPSTRYPPYRHLLIQWNSARR